MKKFLLSLIGLAAILGMFLLASFKTAPVKAITPITTTYDFITTDNGMQGLWATDYFHSTLVITGVDEGVWEVVRTDTGTFTSLPGAGSPGGEGGTLIGDGTTGTISGGITVRIYADGLNEWAPQDGPEDLRNAEGNYFQRYFDRFFNGIESGTIESWGWTYTTCNNGAWVDNNETESIYNEDGPNEEMGDITGEYVPCRQEPTPEPTPLSCSGDTHPDAAGKNCVSYQFGGPSNNGGAGGGVLGTSTQVLGASTMAKTGALEQNFYLALMSIGGLFILHAAKSFKKII